MNNYIDLLYIIFFFMMLIISFLILLASNFEKLFKQGKIVEIRIAYVIMSIIISYLVSEAFIALIERTHSFLN